MAVDFLSTNSSSCARPHVVVFDHTLLWPLILHDTRPYELRPPASSDDAEQRHAEWVREITASRCWSAVSMASDALFRQPYEEVVYFHPFVRKFLYDRPGTGQDPEDCEFRGGVSVFERTDVIGVKACIGIDQDRPAVEVSLAVSHVQLFLFDTFVAIIAVRLTNAPAEPLQAQLRHAGWNPPGPLDLDVVLAFQEYFRRCYPPFWWDGAADDAAPGLCPKSVEWILNPSQPARDRDARCRADYARQARYREFVHLHVQSPVAAHLQYLLEPLAPFRARMHEHVDGESWLAYRQILDERVPVMSYLQLDDVTRLNEADFFRICFCDSPGEDPRDFPYSEASPDVRSFPGPFVYDRFWGPRGRAETVESPDAEKSPASPGTTRYLCCGFAFAVVGDASDPLFRNHLRNHFHHHYFKLGLIAHFGRASLLAFDDRLAYAVQRRSQDESGFRQRLTVLEDEFITFRTRYWFSEVTNHLQGREIFDWWSGHLEVDSLFAQVEGKIHTVNEVLERQDTHQLNRRIEILTNWSIGIAVISLVVSLVTLGRDVIDWLTPNRSPQWELWLIASVAILCAAVASLSRWVAWIQSWVARDSRHLRRVGRSRTGHSTAKGPEQ